MYRRMVEAFKSIFGKLGNKLESFYDINTDVTAHRERSELKLKYISILFLYEHFKSKLLLQL